MLDAQQVVYHFESLLFLWEVNTTYVDDTLELTLRVIAKEGKNWDYAAWRDI